MVFPYDAFPCVIRKVETKSMTSLWEASRAKELGTNVYMYLY